MDTKRNKILVDVTKLPEGKTVGQVVVEKLKAQGLWTEQDAESGDSAEATEPIPPRLSPAATARLEASGLAIEGELPVVRESGRFWTAVGEELSRQILAGKSVWLRDAIEDMWRRRHGYLPYDGRILADDVNDDGSMFGLARALLNQWVPEEAGGMGDTVYELDLGAGGTFIAFGPNGENDRFDWEFVLQVDPTDRAAIDSLTFDEVWRRSERFGDYIPVTNEEPAHEQSTIQVGAWGDEEWNRVWLAIGQEVDRRFDPTATIDLNPGTAIDLRDVAYLVAEYLFDSPDDDDFVDEVSDRLQDLGECLFSGPEPIEDSRCATEPETICSLDFGTGHAYLALMPNSDLLRNDWVFLRRFEPGDKTAVEGLSFEDLWTYL